LLATGIISSAFISKDKEKKKMEKMQECPFGTKF
jgi:hypothetical protein